MIVLELLGDASEGVDGQREEAADRRDLHGCDILKEQRRRAHGLELVADFRVPDVLQGRDRLAHLVDLIDVLGCPGKQ